MTAPMPPQGVVAFLFTDIEGSTRLWEQYPEAMRAVLARHDTLLRTIIETNGGYVFKTIGDAFCAAFPTAFEALRAAILAQRSLIHEPWESGLQLKVRMALHIGDTEYRNGDYFGPTLNRVARMLSVGHGGQVLISEIFREGLTEMPSSVMLVDLGKHPLKDINEPIAIWQVVHPDLPAGFPPLRSLSPQRTNLPAPTTAFIGREREVADIKRLAAMRMVTVTGIGGTGKTRLCLEVGATRMDEFPNGVWFVGLEHVTDPAQVPQMVAEAMGVRETPGKDLTQSLGDALRDQHLLLILDNCEPVIRGVTDLSDYLLRACPQVHILATSQEPLGVTGELVYPLLPLPEPDAIRLFADRAVLARPNFAVASNGPAIARLCRRLDGLPLALELAAARVKMLTLEQIEERLDDTFRLLTDGGQPTLRTLIDWSYEQLHERERTLLARLGVFVGGWTLESAEAVCADERIVKWEVLDLLTELLDKSLLISEDRGMGARYRMLETIRQYSRERLAQSGEEEQVRRNHAVYFLEYAEVIVKDALRRGSEEGLNAIEREYDNLRAALDYLAAAPDGGEAGMRLTTSLAPFWEVRGHWREGRARCAVALAHPSAQEPTYARAVTSDKAGRLAYLLGDYEDALRHYDEALTIFHQLQDPSGTATSMNNIGSVHSDMGEYERAYGMLKEALAIRRRREEPMMVTEILINLGNVRLRQGDVEGALPNYLESYRLSTRINYPMGQMYASDCLGYAAYRMGNATVAREWYSKALPMARELGSPAQTANILCGLAQTARLDRHYTLAARFSGVQEALREEIGAPLQPAYQEEYARHIAETKAILGEGLFNPIFQAGKTMSRKDAWKEALHYALAPEEAADETIQGI